MFNLTQSLLKRMDILIKDDDHFLKESCTLDAWFYISDSLDSRSCRSAILPRLKQV